ATRAVEPSQRGSQPADRPAAPSATAGTARTTTGQRISAGASWGTSVPRYSPANVIRSRRALYAAVTVTVAIEATRTTQPTHEAVATSPLAARSAAETTDSFEKNPASGTTPAPDAMARVIVVAVTGSAL